MTNAPPPTEPDDPTIRHQPDDPTLGDRGTASRKPKSRSRVPESVLMRLRQSPAKLIRLKRPGAPVPPDRRYVVVKAIARGGMGQVLEVRDENLRRIVAMKVLRPELRKHDEWLARFLEEAHITGQLEHPGIIPVHELGVSSAGHVYFTMKRVEGKSLEWMIQRIKQKDEEICRQYTLNRRLEIFVKVCEAIAFAHAHGVIHRDLKPSNVMTGRFGEVLVMDWGLAKKLDEKEEEPLGEVDLPENMTLRQEMGGLTRIGEVIGTPGYMAPEQAAGALDEIDERSDVFSLGALLYALISGRAPYVGETSSDVIADTLTAPLKPVRELTPRTPKRLAAICEKALEKFKDDRYASAAELQEDVRRFIDGRSVLARPDPWPVRLWRFLNRHRSVTIPVVALIIALAGGWAYRAHQVRELERGFRQEARLLEFSRELSTVSLGYLEDAEATLTLARRLIITGAIPVEAVDQFLLFFKEQLAIRPHVYGMSLILRNGRYWTVSRAGPDLFRLETGEKVEDIRYAYAERHARRFEDDPARAEAEERSAFDPWRQDWLRQAPELPPLEIRWSDIYPLTSGRRLGITGSMALAEENAGGQPSDDSIGGLAIDLELAGLSEALQGYLEQDHAVGVIVDQQNRLIAFPPGVGESVVAGDRFTPVVAARLLGPAAHTWGTSLDHDCSGDILRFGDANGFATRCIDLGHFSNQLNLQWSWRVWSFYRN